MYKTKRLKFTLYIFIACCLFVFPISGQTNVSDSESYLSWNSAQIEAIGNQMRQKGQVGSRVTLRGLNTQRAINYKLRATLMSPELIRAAARQEQLRARLSDEQTRQLVLEAENAAELVIMVELDPNEGSGVIPLDWVVFLQPKGLKEGNDGVIAGVKSPQFRNIGALGGVFKRKYDYDVFFVAFPLVDENHKSLIPDEVTSIELVVGINGKEGTVDWRIPASIREKINQLLKSN